MCNAVGSHVVARIKKKKCNAGFIIVPLQQIKTNCKVILTERDVFLSSILDKGPVSTGSFICRGIKPYFNLGYFENAIINSSLYQLAHSTALQHQSHPAIPQDR